MKKILTFVTIALTMFACSKQDDAPEGMLLNKDGEKTVFYATTEGSTTPGTKVFADEDLKVLWNADDRISIFNMSTQNDQYMFTGDDGDTGGQFEEVPANTKSRSDLEHVYAVYPFSADNAIDNTGSQITVNLPEEQSYLEHSFGKGANTMVAVTDDNFLGFKNVCGYLRFRFYGDNVSVKSIKLEGNNEEKIAGKAYIAPVMEGTPTVSMDETATGSITMNCSDPVTIGTSSTDYTEFIFVIPPTVFSKGFKVTVTDNNGGIFEKSSTKSLTISRNKIESMGAMKVVPQQVALTYTLVTDYSELTEGSEVVVVSTAYSVALGTEMWSYPYRKMVEVTKSADKSTVENPADNVQIFTLKKGSADNTVLFECKNGSFAGKYIGARIDASPSSNYSQWKYLYNCDATETEKGISMDIHLDANGDAQITPYNTASRYKYLSCDYSNEMFCMYDAYLTNYAIAIYKLDGTGEGGDQLIVPSPEIRFTSGVNTPSGYEGMDYVGNTMYLPAAGGTYTVDLEVLYPKEDGFIQNVVNINGGGYNTIPGLSTSWNESKTQLTVTLPQNTTSSSRSAYMVIEYSYTVDGSWVDLQKMLYIAQTGAVIK